MNGENIEEILNKLGREDVPAEVQKIAEETSQQFAKSLTPPKQHILWRDVLRSRITKLAAAAVIILGVILSMTVLDKTVAPAFGMNDVLAAIAQAEWMHMTCDYTKVDTGRDLVERGIKETWISVNPKRSITIYKDGSINFVDYLNDALKAQEYDAETKMLTVRYRPASKDYPYATIVDMCLGGLSELEKEGAKVEYTEGVYGGNPVKIINVDMTDDSGVHLQLSIIADDQTYLPICKTSLREELGKRTTENTVFDYPEMGPTDIYQAGAPRNVEVRVIDYRPSCKFLEAIKPYRAARENLPKERIVVEVANENDNPWVVSVVYTSGIKERFEQLKYVRDDTAPDTNDFETILNWANSVKSNELAIQLNDGSTVYCVNRDYAGRWTSKEESTSRYRVGLVVAGLIHRGWPKIDVGKPVDNNYAVENGLLCIETTREPSFADTELAEAAEKTLYYLDPEYDYICVRMESFRHPVPPPWGNAKVSAMDFEPYDPYDIPSEPYLIMEVVEFGQTQTGHWYPSRTITTNKQSWTDKGSGWRMHEKTFDVRLYIDVNPHFPQGVFDPQELPR